MSEQKLGDELDAMLLALPIRSENIPALTSIRSAVAALIKDRNDWRSQFELYSGSWLRNLGGLVFRKRHHIDALAMTTQHQREGCRRAIAAGLIGEVFYSSDPKDAERRALVSSPVTNEGAGR